LDVFRRNLSWNIP